MSSSAYLSAYFFRYRIHPKIFPISLISYDRIYANVDLNDLPWEQAPHYRKNDIDESTLARANEREKTQNFNFDFWASGLADLLEWDYRNLEDLHGILLDLKFQGPEKTRSFLSHKLRQPHYNKRPVYLTLLSFWIRSYMKIAYRDLYADDVLDVASADLIANEFFTTQHLIKKTDIFPILTYEELEFRKIFKIYPIIIPQPRTEKEKELNDKFIQFIYKELKRENKATVQLEQPTKHSVVDTLMDLVVPKFEDVPLREIVLLRKKDKISSISKLAEEIRETKFVTNLDISKIFVDKLWKMGRTLQPSIGENIIGVLGEIPLPVINPFGIVSTYSSLASLMKFNKDYAWFVALSDIEKKSKATSKKHK